MYECILSYIYNLVIDTLFLYISDAGKWNISEQVINIGQKTLLHNNIHFCKKNKAEVNTNRASCIV